MLLVVTLPKWGSGIVERGPRIHLVLSATKIFLQECVPMTCIVFKIKFSSSLKRPEVTSENGSLFA